MIRLGTFPSFWLPKLFLSTRDFGTSEANLAIMASGVTNGYETGVTRRKTRSESVSESPRFDFSKSLALLAFGAGLLRLGWPYL